MKLLFLIKTLALPGGGAERVLAEVAAGLTARGHEVTVASFDAPGSFDFYPFDARVRRIRLGVGRVSGRSGAIVTVRRIAALRALARRERPEVAIGFMHSAYVPLGLAMAGLGIPVVASEHIVHGHYADRPTERLLLRMTAPLFAAITAVSSAMRDSFPPAIRRRMTLLPNPVRVDLAGHGGRESSGPKTLLTVGRLEPQKDHATLIDAFAAVAKKIPEWRLRIIGEGALRPALERQVADHSLDDRVLLPGATADIDAEYRAADLFVMPSRYESFGIATAEAMAHGLPAVGFADCPGTNDLIGDRVSGVLVAGDDRVAALAEGLARLMASPEDRARMGAAAPARVADYAPERIVDCWEALLEGTGAE